MGFAVGSGHLVTLQKIHDFSKTTFCRTVKGTASASLLQLACLSSQCDNSYFEPLACSS